MAKSLRKLDTCNNCKTKLTNNENFCPQCGQENHDKQASTIQLANDFVEDYVGFDNKFFRSIIPLLIRPGVMTVEFLDGKRKKYISPIRLFIFVTFIYFAFYLWFYSDWEGAVTINGQMPSAEKEKAFIQSFQNNLNLIAFIFVPVQALIIMSFYWSKKRKYFVNYFVYTLHLFSFLLLLGFFVQIIHLFVSDENEIAQYAELIWLAALIIYIIYYSIVSLKRVFQVKYNVLRFIVVFSASLFSFGFVAFGFVMLLAWLYEL